MCRYVIDHIDDGPNCKNRVETILQPRSSSNSIHAHALAATFDLITFSTKPEHVVFPGHHVLNQVEILFL